MKNNFYAYDCKTVESPDFGDFRLIRCIFPGEEIAFHGLRPFHIATRVIAQKTGRPR